jgi:hypothetical protein
MYRFIYYNLLDLSSIIQVMAQVGVLIWDVSANGMYNEVDPGHAFIEEELKWI